MAFARAKVHWGKLDAEKLMTEGPPEGKEHRKPGWYYDGILKGARLVAEQCVKDIIFPESSCAILCKAKQSHLYVGACYV